MTLWLSYVFKYVKRGDKQMLLKGGILTGLNKIRKKLNFPQKLPLSLEYIRSEKTWKKIYIPFIAEWFKVLTVNKYTKTYVWVLVSCFVETVFNWFSRSL